MDDLIRRSDAIKVTWQEPSYTDAINALTEARERINDIPAVEPKHGEWIPCEERLPSESGYYLVTCDGGYELSNYIQTIWFAHEDDYAGCESEWREIDDDEIVLAWMPLPEPLPEPWKGADE